MSKQIPTQVEKKETSSWGEMTNPFKQLDMKKFPTQNEKKTKQNGVILIPKN